MQAKKNFFYKILLTLALLSLIAVACFLTACGEGNGNSNNGNGGGDNTNTGVSDGGGDLNESITSVYGTYSHYVGYDTLMLSFPNGFDTGVTDDSGFYQYSTLTLLSDSTGDRYILTRDCFQTYFGMHYWQQYLGSFTWEEGSQDVVLSTPDEYSYYYNFGSLPEETGIAFDTKWALQIEVDLSQQAIDEGRTLVLDDGSYSFPGETEFRQGTSAAGLYGFNNEVCYFVNTGGMGEMTLTLDMNTKAFSYNFDD